ncbi:MAG: glycosyl hydrolase family 28-related protein [Phycicoccus sp.]
MTTRRKFLFVLGTGVANLAVGGCDVLSARSAPGDPAPSPSSEPGSPGPGSGPLVLEKGARQYEQRIVYPADALIQNGGSVYDVRNPPAPELPKALGDGVADDTPALIAAFDHVLKLMDGDEGPSESTTATKKSGGSFLIYLPEGDYRVVDTITYTGPTRLAKNPNSRPGKDRDLVRARENVVGIKFVGETRDGSVIRLAPGSPGFDDPESPRPIVQFIRPEIDFNNRNSIAHGCRNLTIDATDNRGAVGVAYWAANSGFVTNVLIRADENAGAIGIHARTGVLAGYLQDLTIEGFDHGLRFDGPPIASHPVLEYLTLSGQRIAGLSVAQASTTVRNLAVAGGATAVELTGQAAQVILLDSDLDGGGSASSAISQAPQSHLHLRNVTVTGFAGAVKEGDKVTAAPGEIPEYSSIGTRFTRAGKKLLGLEIKDVPIPAYDPDTKNWVKPSGLDQSSVQAAFSAGKPVVYFPSNDEYLIERAEVPATTMLIDGMGGDFSGTLVIAEESDDPLVITDMRRVVVENLTNRAVVLLSSAKAIVNTVAGTEWYLCNAGGINVEKFSSAHVWGRWINAEGKSYLDVKNCDWVQMGYKTERQGKEACIQVSDSSNFELLGGTFGVSTSADLIRLDESSQLSAVISNSDPSFSQTSAEPIVDAGGELLPKESFPMRALDPRRKGKRFRSGRQYFYDVRAVDA